MFCVSAEGLDVMSEDTEEVGVWEQDDIIIPHDVQYRQGDGQVR